MQPSLALFALTCVSCVLAKPQVYTATLREALFHGNAAEINQTADAAYDSLHNKTFLSTVQSTLTDVPTAYRHHGVTLNESALLDSSLSRAQFETAFNTFADIQYVHNSSMISALIGPAVQNFSSSLSKGDRETYYRLLDEQRKMTSSQLEAFSDYTTTRAWISCANSSPRGNLTTFSSCRDVSHSTDLDLLAPEDARRQSLVDLGKKCFTYAVRFSMTILGIHVSAIIALALRASTAAYTLFVIGFIPLIAAWSSAGCVTYTAIAVDRLDHTHSIV